jgi:hypothetical protein
VESLQAKPRPRGKAKYECGCFGNQHNALTNCLICGRISCEKEGYDFCPFCGYLVEEVKPIDGDTYVFSWLCARLNEKLRCPLKLFSYCPSFQHTLFSLCCDSAPTDEAWKYKERLLRYDREFAQRTVILDDQADYYSDTTSAWLTEEEREAAANNEQQRHDDIHKRKKMQLNLRL